MLDKIKKFLFWTKHTKLGWFLISFIWAATFTIIDNNIEDDWAYWLAIPGIAYMFALVLVTVVYAWVINPIREYRKNKKK
jgi:uncharacterized membrane protein